MVNLLSPGVTTREVDLTTIIPSVSTSVGAFVGSFNWGPVEEITLLSNELELVSRFGKPTNTEFVSFFVAANFLAYSNALRLVRVVDNATALNATLEVGTGSNVPGTGILIKNRNFYEANYKDGSGDVGLFAAKYPGDLGNSLKVSVCPSAAAYSKTLTGTVSSTGTAVVGVGTSFLTELEVGSFIVNSLGEERQVVSIADATNLVINSAFSVNLSSATVIGKWEYANQIRFNLGTSPYTQNLGGANDEMHVVVVDEDGKFSGVPGTILERFVLVSKAEDAKKEDGDNLYYKEVINNTSSYIWWMDHIPATNFGSPAAGTTFTSPIKPYTYSFVGGQNGSVVSDGAKLIGLDLFNDRDVIDISLLITGDASPTVANYAIQLCENRGDCIAFVSPQQDDVVSNPGQEVTDILAFRANLVRSSYGVLDSGYKRQYDKYNAVTRFVPLNGDIAGLCARTDRLREPWYSPAGVNRGQVINLDSLAFNPNKPQRDDLFVADVNPVATLPGTGTILIGDKTLLGRPSAFDAINVRRLFIILKKAISRAVFSGLFEQNTPFTRQLMRTFIVPYLEDIRGRSGITDFRVVCDSTNNTPEVIDRNELIIDVYVKPVRSIRYIQLNTIAVRTGVEFSEIVGNVNL